jgi:hypothetical protein
MNVDDLLGKWMRGGAKIGAGGDVVMAASPAASLAAKLQLAYGWIASKAILTSQGDIVTGPSRFAGRGAVKVEIGDDCANCSPFDIIKIEIAPISVLMENIKDAQIFVVILVDDRERRVFDRVMKKTLAGRRETMMRVVGQISVERVVDEAFLFSCNCDAKFLRALLQHSLKESLGTDCNADTHYIFARCIRVLSC